jgi:Transferrin receptor-like dimerisation domain.
MRFASADLLPFTFSNFAETVTGYTTELERLRDAREEQITDANRLRDEGVYTSVSDPRDPLLGPPVKTKPPQFNFAPMLNALDSLTSAAKRYDRLAAMVSSGTNMSASKQARLISINQRLLQAERALTSNDGLRGRTWYKHLIYAPGFYTGYGVKTVPAVREAIEQGQWDDVDREIARVGAALTREATLVSSLANELAISN